MNRRGFLGGSLAAVVAGSFGTAAANVPVPISFDVVPPMDSKANFIAWMQKNRGENPDFLAQRWDLHLDLIGAGHIWGQRNARAFLLTPREEFVTEANAALAYATTYLDIGFGGYITDPMTIARMNSSLELQVGEKVLEIGTGSGYQSAYLSNLTNRVWSIEIIKPLFERTGSVYASLINRGYSEYRAISRAQGDGYYGWPDAAPFDKIIVTCGIDHIPPPLLQQLKPDGIMMIPIGAPGAQHVLKVTKKVAADGSITVTRLDILNGLVLPFMTLARPDAVAAAQPNN